MMNMARCLGTLAVLPISMSIAAAQPSIKSAVKPVGGKGTITWNGTFVPDSDAYVTQGIAFVL